MLNKNTIVWLSTYIFVIIKNTSAAEPDFERLKKSLFTELAHNNITSVKAVFAEAKSKGILDIADSQLGIDNNSKIPIEIAIEGNKSEMLKVLIEEGADINSVFPCDALDRTPCTALHIAAENNFTKAAELLLAEGALTFVRDKRYASYKAPLHYAVEYNYAEIAQLLLNFGAEIDIKDSEGFTPLYFAIKAGNLEMIKILLDSGAGVNVTNGAAGYGVLHAIAFATQNIEQMVEILLEKVKVNALEQLSLEGRTPLQEAVNSLNAEASKVFIKNGAFLDESLLNSAVYYDDSQTAAILVDGGINVSHCLTNMNWTDWHLKTFTGQLNSTEVLAMDAETIDHQDVYGSTALHIGVKHRFLRGVKLLLEKGANLNIQDGDGWTPIFYSLQKGDFVILNILYKRGADIDNIQDNYYRTPSSYSKLLFDKTIPQVIEYELVPEISDSVPSSSNITNISWITIWASLLTGFYCFK